MLIHYDTECYITCRMTVVHTKNEYVCFFSVHKVFEEVAHTYDKMNDCMSFGIHRIWKDIFMQRLSPIDGTRLLDVGGGTGKLDQMWS